MMSISDSAYKRERTRLLELANEYKAKGYEVLVEPGPQQRPEFLRDFQPDLIAVSPTDRVVVEVKSKASLRESKYLESLAREVEKQEGWRLEFVLTNPRERQDTSEQWSLLSIPEIQNRLAQARNIATYPQQTESAMLLLWVIVEAILLHIAQRESMSILGRTPRRLVKEFFSLGLLTEQDFELLNRAAEFRNRIVHGYTSNTPATEILESTERLAARLLTELASSSDNSEKQSAGSLPARACT